MNEFNVKHDLAGTCFTFQCGVYTPQFSIRSQQKEKYNILELFIAGISNLIWSIDSSP